MATSPLPPIGDPAIRKRLDAIAAARDGFVSGNISAFEKALAAVAGEFKQSVLGLLAAQQAGGNTGLLAASLDDLTAVQTEIKAQLVAAGYPQLAQKFVGKFDQSQELALDTLKAVQVDPTKFTVFDKAAIANLKAMNLDWLEHLGDQAVASVSRGIVQSSLLGTGRAQTIKAISQAVDSNLNKYAATYYDTALNTFDRTVHWQAYTAAGVSKFVYVGPADIKTRPFCSTHLNKVYTKTQMAAMTNGTSLSPVSRFAGGYNCRHHWMPAPEAVGQPEARTPLFIVPEPDQNPKATPAEKLTAAKNAKKGAAAGLTKALNADKGGVTDHMKVQSAKLKLQDAQDALLTAQANFRASAKQERVKKTFEKWGQTAGQAAQSAQQAKLAAFAANPPQPFAVLDAKLQEGLAFGQAKQKASKIIAAKGTVTKAVTKLQAGLVGQSGSDPAVFAKKMELKAAIDPKLAALDKQIVTSTKALKKMEPGSYAAQLEAFKIEQANAAKAGLQAKFGAYIPTAAEIQTHEEAKKAIAALKSVAAKAAGNDPTAVDAAWEVLKGKGGLKFESMAAVGGNTGDPKEFWTDAAGNRYLVKPQPAGRQITVYAEESAYKVARLINPDAVEVRAFTFRGPDGKMREASLQKIVTNEGELKGLARGQEAVVKAMSTKQLAQVQAEQVVDWLVSNHDGHAGQFLRMADGSVRAIDKAQAWKFLGRDRLAADYHPNQVETEPIYNTMLRLAKKGDIKLDPAATLAAIKRAEAITDDQLRAALQQLQEAKGLYTPGQEKGFVDSVIARRNSIRADFERLYQEALNNPNFRFEPKAAAAQTDKVAAPGFVYLDQAAIVRVEKAAKAGWQGQTIIIDKADIEDQNVRVNQETGPDGHPRTVITFRMRPEAQDKVVKALGVDPNKPVSAVVAAAKSPAAMTPAELVTPFKKDIPGTNFQGWYWTGPDGKEHAIASNQQFQMLLNGQTPSFKKPYGSGMMSDQEKADLQAAAKLYLQHVDQARAALAKPATTAPAKVALEAKLQVPTLSERKVQKGGDLVAVADNRKFSDITGGADPDNMKQVAIKFADGATGTVNLWVKGQTAEGNVYAHQGRVQMLIPGPVTPERVEAAMRNVDLMGMSAKVAAPEDRERLYLTQHAAINKLADSAEWKKAEAGGVPAMRAFWSKRVGADVTALKTYNPDGVYEWDWRGEMEQAGSRRLLRFDMDIKKEMGPQLTIYHATRYGGKDTVSFLEAALPTNRALISTIEKARIGVPISRASGGASAVEDQRTGGASYAFTRLRNHTNDSGLYFKPHVLKRMDAISYGSDMYGRVHGTNPSRQRAGSIQEWRDNSNKYSNETIFKDSLSILHDLDFIKAASPDERDRIIQAFKNNGIKEFPDGRPVESVVKL
jgi:hypothetical protein